MTRATIFMITSFRASKKAFRGIPRSPILPKTTPNTIENTTSPKTFKEPFGSTLTPFGTVLEPGLTSFTSVKLPAVALIVLLT